MNFDDEILQLLGTHADTTYSARQIGTCMSSEWSASDPDWAMPSLELLVIQRRVHFEHGKYWFQSRAGAPPASAL